MSCENRIQRARSIIGFWQLALVVPALAACGAEAPAASEEEFGEVTQAFGESTCGLAQADVTMAFDGPTVVSPDANYDDPNCRNAFVATGTFNIPPNFPPFEYGAFVKYRGVIADGVTFPCNVMWAKLSVWQRPTTAPFYSKLGDYVSYGTRRADGSCLAPGPIDEDDVPLDGVSLPSGKAQYKVIGQAGFLYYYQPVGLSSGLKFF